MIELTPLDVRNKRGDFRRGLRGYEPQEVDAFLESVADRMDVLVREVMALRERANELKTRVERQDARETAVQEALVSAQSLREEIRAQAQREAELVLRAAEQEGDRKRAEVAEAAGRVRREAEQHADQLNREAEQLAERARAEIARALDAGRRELEELHRSRTRFLRAYRTLLERELDVVDMEESRPGSRERDLDLDLDALQIFRGAQAPEPATHPGAAAEPFAGPDHAAGADVAAAPGSEEEAGSEPEDSAASSPVP
jgi:cell division initiation protein